MRSRYWCAGISRHEAENAKFLRERTSDPLGPESCADTARHSVKRRQGHRRGETPLPAKSPQKNPPQRARIVAGFANLSGGLRREGLHNEHWLKRGRR